MRIELACCERMLLEEIANPKMFRKDVAQTYSLALLSSECKAIDWAKVNQAILDRWSPYALGWIKNQAWSGAAFKEKV